VWPLASHKPRERECVSQVIIIAVTIAEIILSSYHATGLISVSNLPTISQKSIHNPSDTEAVTKEGAPSRAPVSSQQVADSAYVWTFLLLTCPLWPNPGSNHQSVSPIAPDGYSLPSIYWASSALSHPSGIQPLRAELPQPAMLVPFKTYACRRTFVDVRQRSLVCKWPFGSPTRMICRKAAK
jgi:hypothetical protein